MQRNVDAAPALETPRRLGFRMPAEWEPQSATWLIWPEHPDHWFADLDRVRWSIARLAAEISTEQRVELLVNDADAEQVALGWLRRAQAVEGNVRLHQIPADLCWMRDAGPTFVVRDQAGQREMAVVHWGYNAWGGKYPPWDHDACIPQRVAEKLQLRRFVPGIVLEGGSIDGNGAGTFLTTEQCLLHPNRNPHLGRGAIEGYLREFLGAEKVLWLGEGIEGDDTDGHIDDIARFVGPTTVVAAVEDDPTDPNYEPLRENFRRLELSTDAQGRRLEVMPLLMPRAVVAGGQRFPASYANFYICNKKVVVPWFGGPRDGLVLDQLAPLFPGRKLVGVPAAELVTGFGAFHCVTQQQPSSAPARDSSASMTSAPTVNRPR